jgi:hypothetical protein
MHEKIITLPNTKLKYIQRGEVIYLDDEVRNVCWNCNRYFDTSLPLLPHEKGQKAYFTCKRCGKVNHL